MSESKVLMNRRSSLIYTDQGQWIQIQRTTFGNWVNEQLRPAGEDVKDLRTDFSDGVHLVTLVEALTNRPVSGALRKPSNQYQKLQNITVALDTVAKDGVKIVNIDSNDIAEGNTKLILALIWMLVLKYQGGLGAAQHRKWMLAWLQAVLPECHIRNFTTDWNDGTALLALLEFCKPGIAPDWRSLDKEDRVSNCRRAMELARDHFDIPLVLLPEDLSSPLLDEKSAILYLSYFTRVGGPGYNATRERIQERVKSREISNFTTDWSDGIALSELVTSCGGEVPDRPPDTSEISALELLQSALEAGKELGMEPLLTAEEIEAEGTEHMGIMAQTAQFLTRSPPATPPATTTEGPRALSYESGPEFDSSDHQWPLQNGNFSEQVALYDDDANSTTTNTNTNASSVSVGGSVSQATPSFQLVRKSSIKSPPQGHALSVSPFRIDIYSVGVIMESKITGRGFDPEQFKVEAEAPSGRVIRMCGDGHYSAQFTPDEIGRWRVSMYYNNTFMDGCPVDVCDPSQVRVRGLRGGHIGKQQNFEVDCTGAGLGDLGVDITHGGKRVPAHVTETLTPRLFKVTYTPYDPGPYEVNVHFNRAEVRDSDFHSTDPEERRRQALFKTHVEEDGGVIRINASCDWEIDYVTGGPFLVHVTDSSDIEVYGMKDGTVCNNPELIVDCTKVGEGTLTAEVTHQGLRYPCKVRRDPQPGVHRVSFKPRGPGVYKIWMDFDGAPVKGSPFVQEIAELGKPRAFGDGLYRGTPDRAQSFTVDPRGHPGHFTAQVYGPLREVPCQLTPQSDGTLLGSYVPMETGPHTVDIRLQGKPIEGSPFKPYIVDPERVRPTGDWLSLASSQGVIPLHVNREKQLPFDASQAGMGELTAEVRGPTGRIPVAIDARNDGRHTVIFTPREEGKHYIDVKWGGFAVVNSPFQGHATWTPEPVVYPETEVVTLRQIPLQSSRLPPAPEEKDIIPLTVGQERMMTFDTAHTGPGKLSATVKGPTKHVPVAVDDRVAGQPSVLFTPQEEGKHLIDVSWNGAPLSVSPFIGFAVREPNNNMYPPPVFLHGQAPSKGRMRDEDKDIIPLTVHREKQIPFDATKAGPGQLRGTVKGPTHGVPASVKDRGDGKPMLCFTPQEEGKHSIDVSWNGAPLAESPMLGYATREPGTNGYTNGLVPHVYLLGHPSKPGHPGSGEKDIIPLQVNQEKALPFDASSAGPGKMTASVRGPSRPIPAKVKQAKSDRPTILFTPEEEGKHDIHVNWNDRPIAQSPFIGYAAPGHRPPNNGLPPVYLAGTHPRKGQPKDHEKGIIPLNVNHLKQLPFDASQAGPGVLDASVRGPTRPVPAHVEDRTGSKPTVTFVPEEEGKHLIDVNWSGRPVPQSPFIGYATKDPDPILLPYNIHDPDVSFHSSLADSPPKEHVQPTTKSPRSRSPVKVILSGRGLKEADVDQPAVFHVDGTQAVPGRPTAHLESDKTNIPVYVEPLRPQVYRCSYVPEVPGPYKLYIRWNEHPLKGSPFKVNVRGPKRSPSKHVIYPHPNNAGKRPGEDLEFTLDHPDPSVYVFKPGQLTVTCMDPRGHVIPCRFQDNLDGTSSVKMTPTMPGRHVVDIRHDNHHVMGSPYYVDISDNSLPGKVRVWGPGIQRTGVLHTFHSHFWVDTTGAGAGELRVRIMGPKGAFHVKMRKAKQREKLYQCFYDPVEAGIYSVHVQWSGVHVEGSPFTVCLASSSEELELMSDLSSSSRPHSTVSGGVGGMGGLGGFLY
ncbi:filamin-A-like [Babylonia areolata]|uniref:filamin-A-like n=1 Tax=Babylonia areolata TaxID=304850 RepID=UPI003FD0D52E